MGFFRKPLLAVVVVAATIGSMGAAGAQPYRPPPGWAGPHYYWHGQHWHHRYWAFDRHHHGYWRYR